MAATESYTPTDPTHYVWWFPGSPLKVHLDLHFVERLQERLQETRHGAAEQGILFGRALEGTTEILDFQPTSDGELPELMAASPTERSRLLPVGYYRTQQEETLRLNEKDLSLADELFVKPYHVFLVIQSTGFGPCNATFFFRGSDHKMAELAFMEFPLDATLLAADERRRIGRSQQAMHDQPVAVQSEGPSASGDRRKRRGGLAKTVAWALSAFLVLVAATVVGTRSIRERASRMWIALTSSTPATSAPQSPSHPTMGLHATRQNGDLDLTWNRDSASIATAISGAISIQDGDALRIIPLDAAQVRGGSLLYAPLTDQIQMRLAVTTPAGVATESVMVILPKVGAPQVKPLGVQDTLARPQGSSDRLPPPKTTREFVAPSASAPNLPPTALPAEAPPVPKASLDSAPTGVRLVPPQAPALLPPAPDSGPPPATAPQTLSPQTVSSAASTYHPPAAIHQIAAVFPLALRSLVYKPRVVEIRVAIDKSGKVVKAEPVPQEGVHQFLINAAVHAAQLWKFQPARQGDQPVPSELILQFVFKQ